MGAALLAIRDGRLYRQTHTTFEDYCRERWGGSKRHANRLVEAAEVVHQLGPVGPIPTTERQTRELARISDPEIRADVWQQAVAEHGARVTA